MTGLGKAIEPRFASLSSGLLARKGQAKPAMRPQGFGGFGHMTMGHEDLGWNDMGYDAPSSDTPPAKVELPRIVDEEFAANAEPPAVLAQRVTLAEEFGDEGEDAGTADSGPSILQVKTRRQPTPEPLPASEPVAAPAAATVPLVVAPVDLPRGRKAAFTLRLDAARHLRLRLACAVDGRSAQQLVTEALDRFLATLPDLGELADRVPAKPQE